MQTKAKENSVVTTAYDAAAETVTYTVIGCTPLVLHLNRVSEACRARAMVHGFGQRVVDGAAIPAEPLADTPEGRELQKKDRAARKHAAMARLVDHYNAGGDEWSPAREGGGGPALDPILLAAVGEVIGKDVAVVREIVAAASKKKEITAKAYLAKLATNADVAKVADRMRAAGAGEMDADEELAGLMG